MEVIWMPFELRRYPTRTLRPEDSYLQNAWRTSVYPMAARLQVEIKLPTISPQPYTQLAFEGLAYAKEHGGAEQYNDAVMRGFFQRDLDIGSPDVLESLASEAGLDAARFRRALDERRYREQHEELLRQAYEEVGVTGVPLLLVEEVRLIGMQDRRTLEAAIADVQSGRRSS